MSAVKGRYERRHLDEVLVELENENDAVHDTRGHIHWVTSKWTPSTPLFDFVYSQADPTVTTMTNS